MTSNQDMVIIQISETLHDVPDPNPVTFPVSKIKSIRKAMAS